MRWAPSTLLKVAVIAGVVRTGFAEDTLASDKVDAVHGAKEHNSWALLIDAGSTGSRMHLYEWAPRVYSKLPLENPISKPITSEKWTERLRPGLSAFTDPVEAATSLKPLIDFAKENLADAKDYWHTYPIYLKATAGMRELGLERREGIINAVREFFKDNETCPFLFSSPEQARVIAGEEEAAYAWTGVNFVKGTLISNIVGSGTATAVKSYGTVEMGGASSQIAFFRPEQDILSNLFKLQVGSQKHWNIYAHSFLQYGRVSARQRMWSHLASGDKYLPGPGQMYTRSGCFADQAVLEGVKPCMVADACLPWDVSLPSPEHVDGTVGLHPPILYSPLVANVEIGGAIDGGSWEQCLEQIVGPLLFDKKAKFGMWCNYTHHGQCGFVGVYQPELPGSDTAFGNFVLIGQFVKLWSNLGLPESGASLNDLAAVARKVCGASHDEIIEHMQGVYGPDRHLGSKKKEEANELCFMAAYAYSMLHFGHGFELDRNFTAIEVMSYEGVDLQVGWQLGSILYEINALPWVYDPEANVGFESPEALYVRDTHMGASTPSAGGADSSTALVALVAATLSALLTASVFLVCGSQSFQGSHCQKISRKGGADSGRNGEDAPTVSDGVSANAWGGEWWPMAVRMPYAAVPDHEPRMTSRTGGGAEVGVELPPVGANISTRQHRPDSSLSRGAPLYGAI